MENVDLKISIITPSFNQSAYIDNTIQSVLNQDYPNIEYIIIDGGSTDGSVDIIKQYQDKLAYWVSEPDNGQSDALNKGFKRATGDIVAWINSDDMYVAGAFAKAAKYFNDHPDVDMIYGNCDLVDEQGKILIYQRAAEFDLKKLVRMCMIPQPSVFMRRKMLDELGYLDTSFRYVMDYDLWLRAERGYNIRHLDAILSCFRLHDSSKTVSQITRFLPEIYRLLNEFFSGLGDKKSSIYPQYIAHIAELMLELQDKDIPAFTRTVFGEDISESEIETLKSFFSGQQISSQNMNQIVSILQRGYQNLYSKYISPCGNAEELIGLLVDTQLLHLSHRLFMEGYTTESKKLFQIMLNKDRSIILNPLSLRLIINYLLTRRGVKSIDYLKNTGWLQLRKAWIYANHLGHH